MRYVSNHRSRLPSFQAILHGQQRSRPTLFRRLLRATANLAANGYKAEFLGHARIEFGIVAAREHRHDRKIIRSSRGRHYMLAMPEGDDGRAEPAQNSFKIRRFFKRRIGRTHELEIAR